MEIAEDLLAEKLLDLAMQAGVDAAEVFQSRSNSNPVSFEANRLKQLENTESEGTALRLWCDGRPGLAVGYGPIDPQILVERAIAISRLNEPETIELTKDCQFNYPDKGEKIAVEQLVNWGEQSIEIIRHQYPEILCAAELDCDIETTRLINSEGLDCYHQDTTLSCGLSVEWVRGDDFLGIYDGQIQRNNIELESITQRILQRLDWAQSNIVPPTGRLPILFTSKAADLLWGTVAAALNGKQVIEGASPWSDRLGQIVISSNMTISQEPEKGPFSCPFDDEGTTTRPIVFIDQGMLQLFYTDRTVGKKLGSGTTGNGFRPSLGSYPTPGLFNFFIAPGDLSFPELISKLDEVLIIDQILGGGAGISGEFSINVDLGYYVKKGEILGRVKDTMVAGNVYTALKQVIALGSDAAWMDSCYTPSLIVDGLSVTSKS